MTTPTLKGVLGGWRLVGVVSHHAARVAQPAAPSVCAHGGRRGRGLNVAGSVVPVCQSGHGRADRAAMAIAVWGLGRSSGALSSVSVAQGIRNECALQSEKSPAGRQRRARRANAHATMESGIVTFPGSAGVCRKDSSLFSSTFQISSAAGRQRLPVPGDAGQNRTAPPAWELVGPTFCRRICRITARRWP